MTVIFSLSFWEDRDPQKISKKFIRKSNLNINPFLRW
jgi:hypothetical protein